jgi:hypothetical protein
MYAAKAAGRNRISSEAGNAAGYSGAVSSTKAAKGPRSVSGSAMLEVTFNDDETPVFFDTALDISDARLQRLLLWYRSLAPVGQMPAWSEALMAQVAPMRDFLQGCETLDNGERFRLTFFGRDIIRALGSDPTGTSISRDEDSPSAVAHILARMREGLMLVTQLKEPLHTFAKAPHRLPTGLYDGESLALPFAYRGRDAGFILAATLFSPVGKSDVRRAIG